MRETMAPDCKENSMIVSTKAMHEQCQGQRWSGQVTVPTVVNTSPGAMIHRCFAEAGGHCFFPSAGWYSHWELVFTPPTALAPKASCLHRLP